MGLIYLDSKIYFCIDLELIVLVKSHYRLIFVSDI